jgi:hypothetical protein
LIVSIWYKNQYIHKQNKKRTNERTVDCHEQIFVQSSMTTSVISLRFFDFDDSISGNDRLGSVEKSLVVIRCRRRGMMEIG